MDKGRQNKIRLGIGLPVLGIVLAAGGIFLFLLSRDTENKSERGPKINFSGENIITAGGITAAGITEEKYELDFLETLLYVEESRLSTGDSVEAGTKVFKVSEESLSEAREELERAATEAALDFRQGTIDYETGKLEAESTLALAQVNSEYAQAEYDSAVFNAREKVADLEKQVEDAQELYREYQEAADNNYYYTEYEVEELQNTYYDNFTFLMELYEKWDIEGLYDKYPGGGSMTSGGSQAGRSDSGSAAAGGESKTQGSPQQGNDESDKLTVYEMMEELVTENGEEYETAAKQYEKDTLMAMASLEQAKSNLATLQAELSGEQLAYEKQIITAKAEYDAALAESENARSVYDTTLQKLEEEYEALKDEKEDTQGHLALFEETLGDGYFYTKTAGTVVMNRVRAGRYLTEEDMLLAYSNPESVTVTAGVDQEDITQIATGDSAYVTVNGYGSYGGTVISIDPVSSSDTRSSVTYTVNIELTGDTGDLESNLTAAVYLGLTEEQLKQMQQSELSSEGKETAENGGEAQ